MKANKGLVVSGNINSTKQLVYEVDTEKHL